MSLPMNFISMKPPIVMARKCSYIMWKGIRIFRPFLELEEKGIRRSIEKRHLRKALEDKVQSVCRWGIHLK